MHLVTCADVFADADTGTDADADRSISYIINTSDMSLTCTCIHPVIFAITVITHYTPFKSLLVTC